MYSEPLVFGNILNILFVMICTFILIISVTNLLLPTHLHLAVLSQPSHTASTLTSVFPCRHSALLKSTNVNWLNGLRPKFRTTVESFLAHIRRNTLTVSLLTVALEHKVRLTLKCSREHGNMQNWNSYTVITMSSRTKRSVKGFTCKWLH